MQGVLVGQPAEKKKSIGNYPLSSTSPCVWNPHTVGSRRSARVETKRHTKKRIHELDFLVAQFSHPSRYHLSNFDLFSLFVRLPRPMWPGHRMIERVCVSLAAIAQDAIRRTRSTHTHTVNQNGKLAPSNQCGIYRLFHLDCSRSLCRLFQ